jgi:hypothetical protein
VIGIGTASDLELTFAFDQRRIDSAWVANSP